MVRQKTHRGRIRIRLAYLFNILIIIVCIMAGYAISIVSNNSKTVSKTYKLEKVIENFVVEGIKEGKISDKAIENIKKDPDIMDEINKNPELIERIKKKIAEEE